MLQNSNPFFKSFFEGSQFFFRVPLFYKEMVRGYRLSGFVHKLQTFEIVSLRDIIIFLVTWFNIVLYIQFNCFDLLFFLFNQILVLPLSHFFLVTLPLHFFDFISELVYPVEWMVEFFQTIWDLLVFNLYPFHSVPSGIATSFNNTLGNLRFRLSPLMNFICHLQIVKTNRRTLSL